MPKVVFSTLPKACDFALVQSTRWGGEWVVYECEQDTFTTCAKPYMPKGHTTLFITEAPEIGEIAVGAYTNAGEDRL